MKKEGKKERLLKYFKKHKKITSLEAFNELGDTRLSATIFELRKDGYNISSRLIKVPTRWGKTTEVAEYRLNK